MTQLGAALVRVSLDAAGNRHVYLKNAPQGKAHMLDKATLAEKQAFVVAGGAATAGLRRADADEEDGH